jgi:hypothetical protein
MYITCSGDHFADNLSALRPVDGHQCSIKPSGAAMSPVSLLKTKTIGPRAINRGAQRQDDAEAGCELVSLISFLEADNNRLWKKVVELSLETLALQQALKKIERRKRAAAAKPKTWPSSRPRVTSSDAQAAKVARLVLASGR